MNFPLYIAKRYLFSKSSNNAINIITIIATVGVIVGSLSLFLVLSVFSGLKEFSANFLNATDPEIRITAAKGKSFFFTDSIQQQLQNTKGIVAYSKIVEERALFNYRKKEQIAYIKGVDQNYTNVIGIDSLINTGKWINYNTNSTVVGYGIAEKLSLGILNYGEPLNVFVPKSGKKYSMNIKNMFNTISTQAVGVFHISDELDNKYVFTSLDVSQKLLGYKNNEISAIDIKSETPEASSIISSLKQSLGTDYNIQSQQELNAVFYKILNTEKLVAYLIFTLVLIIALFNVIGSIIMMILDKKKNLKTLYNLGTSIKEIKKIFILQGFLLSLFGLFAGITLGTIAILFQNKFQLFMITQDIPYPIVLKLTNVLLVCTTIISLGYLAARIASSRISKNLVD